MLVQLKKLNIIDEGYNRTSISLDKVYINPSHIISVIDYDGAREFLLREGNLTNSEDRFSLLKLSTANKVEEIIVLGTSEQVYNQIQSHPGRELLNG